MFEYRCLLHLFKKKKVSLQSDNYNLYGTEQRTDFNSYMPKRGWS